MKFRINIGFKNLYFIVLCIVLMIETNPTYKENRLIRYGAIMICFILFCFRYIQRRQFRLNLFFIWSVCELALCILSSTWSLDSKTTIQACKNIFIVLFICTMTYSMVENKNDFRALWKSVCMAYLFNSVYVLYVVGINNFGVARLGVDFAGLERWNANAIGALAGFGCIMFIHDAVTTHCKIRELSNYCMALFLLLMCLNSGSRKAILVIAISLILYFYLKAKGKKRFRNIMIMVFLLIVAWNIITANAELYKLIGARMERMISSLLGHQTSENSMGMRMHMITQGVDYFRENPILGYGLDCYRYLSPFKTYAHNNFIELMVGTGIVGLIIYYSIYVYGLVYGWYFVFKVRDDMAIFLFSMLVIVVVNHMAIVSYDDISYNFVFLLFITYLKLYLQETKKGRTAKKGYRYG